VVAFIEDFCSPTAEDEGDEQRSGDEADDDDEDVEDAARTERSNTFNREAAASGDTIPPGRLLPATWGVAGCQLGWDVVLSF
jgi:hypothetical protein